ncbi:MAG TPA: ester cyclase [Puia sp.]|nr:ester cyclase [Puia sp.]
MNQLQKNKEFLLEYANALSGKPKTRESLEKYSSDEGLLDHICFFESVFPNYQIFFDELTAEGNRVVCRARFKGRNEGEFKGFPPTHKDVEFSFAIGYEIENDKIVHHWLIADQMILMEQLGLEPMPA